MYEMRSAVLIWVSSGVLTHFLGACMYIATFYANVMSGRGHSGHMAPKVVYCIYSRSFHCIAPFYIIYAPFHNILLFHILLFHTLHHFT